MLSETRRDCMNYANKLGNYQKIDLTDLLNGYCDALDNDKYDLQSSYLSAIILRFWYTIDKIGNKSQGLGLQREDFFDWLVEAINYACKYRAWQQKDKKVSAQSCINQCIETIRHQHYYDFNLDKHKMNYNNVSLDATLDDSDDGKTTVLDTLADEADQEQFNGMESAKAFIQRYINNNKIVEAIILDTIAFNDVEKHTTKTIKIKATEESDAYKYVETTSEFWAFKAVQLLSTLSPDYIQYFSDKYRITPSYLRKAIEAIKSANNQKLYRYLRATLADAKNYITDLCA